MLATCIAHLNLLYLIALIETGKEIKPRIFLFCNCLYPASSNVALTRLIKFSPKVQCEISWKEFGKSARSKRAVLAEFVYLFVYGHNLAKELYNVPRTSVACHLTPFQTTHQCRRCQSCSAGSLLHVFIALILLLDSAQRRCIYGRHRTLPSRDKNDEWMQEMAMQIKRERERKEVRK
jgi:hypothetical protein